jgi:hypothetical protein
MIGFIASGSVKQSTAPPSRRLVAQIRPLWFATIVRAMESPIPIPAPSVVKNGSNICSLLSGGMPGPESSIATSAKAPSRSVVRAVTVRRTSTRSPPHRSRCSPTGSAQPSTSDPVGTCLTPATAHQHMRPCTITKGLTCCPRTNMQRRDAWDQRLRAR